MLKSFFGIYFTAPTAIFSTLVTSKNYAQYFWDSLIPCCREKTAKKQAWIFKVPVPFKSRRLSGGRFGYSSMGDSQGSRLLAKALNFIHRRGNYDSLWAIHMAKLTKLGKLTCQPTVHPIHPEEKPYFAAVQDLLFLSWRDIVFLHLKKPKVIVQNSP